MISEENYLAGFALTAILVFIGSWIYCIVTYGFLFGVGLGWLPSLIVAVIAGALWPLLVGLLGFLVIVAVIIVLSKI